MCKIRLQLLSGADEVHQWGYYSSWLLPYIVAVQGHLKMHETLAIVHSAAPLFSCVSSVGICPISCLLIQFFGLNSLWPYYYVISLNFYQVWIKVWKDCEDVTNLCVDCSTQRREVCGISFVTNLFFFWHVPTAEFSYSVADSRVWVERSAQRQEQHIDRCESWIRVGTLHSMLLCRARG